MIKAVINEYYPNPKVQGSVTVVGAEVLQVKGESLLCLHVQLEKDAHGNTYVMNPVYLKEWSGSVKCTMSDRRVWERVRKAIQGTGWKAAWSSLPSGELFLQVGKEVGV